MQTAQTREEEECILCWQNKIIYQTRQSDEKKLSRWKRCTCFLFLSLSFLEGGTNAMSFYRKLYRGLETFSCGILMLLSSLSLPRNLPEFFRDLLILTKFCQTRSIGSPDAFFQFPLKCFQQRLPFLASDIKECTFHQILPFSLKLNHGIYLRLLKNILDFNK